MGVVFREAVGVDQVGVDGVVAERAGGVIDHVRWVDEVSAWQTLLGAWSLSLESRVGRLEVCWEARKGIPGRSDGWRLGREFVVSCETFRIRAWVDTEVGRFVHIDP